MVLNKCLYSTAGILLQFFSLFFFVCFFGCFILKLFRKMVFFFASFCFSYGKFSFKRFFILARGNEIEKYKKNGNFSNLIYFVIIKIFCLFSLNFFINRSILICFSKIFWQNCTLFVSNSKYSNCLWFSRDIRINLKTHAFSKIKIYTEIYSI